MKPTTYYLDGFLEAIHDPPILREARALAAKLGHMPLNVRPDERIIGRYHYEPFDFHWGSGVFCRNGQYQEANLSEQERARLLAKVEAARPYVTWPYLFGTLAEHERQALDAGLVTSLGCGSHMAFDHRRLLALGLPSLSAEIDRHAWQYRNDPGKDDFFKAMRLALEAVKTFILRHAEEAERVASETAGEARARFRAIAADCRFICEQPPHTFRQALQQLWFLHILNDCDSFGRFDQALEPFYRQDLAEGRLTRREAADLLTDVWLKLSGTQNMTIGGRDASGQDTSSDLTLLCIEVTLQAGRAEPNLCLRTHPHTPESVWEAAGRCIGRGTGLPALYNDEVIIPALVELGISTEDAADYALAGCSQTVIPGRSNFGCDDGVFHAAKCLELALHDGIDPLTGFQLGPQTGGPESFADFQGFKAAFRKQVAAAAALHGRILDKTDVRRSEFCGFPLRSLLTEDCLARGLNIWQGGARYNAIQSECVGITNAADSLTAIEKLVFTEKRVSLPELVSRLDSDWKDAEILRRSFIRSAPKFGNDDERADSMAAWVSRLVWGEIRRYRCARGNGPIIPGGIVFSYHSSYGKKTGATPDGRRRYAPLADSTGPSQGRDRCGPTGVIRSTAKLPLSLATTCAVLNMKFTRQVFASETAREKVLRLFQSYFNMGGMQLQVTVANRDELLAAQRDPERYGGLVVRVGGYSAYFTSLSSEMQDEIISRTENV